MVGEEKRPIGEIEEEREERKEGKKGRWKEKDRGPTR